MSRTYQCQLRESVTDTVRASDESVCDLHLTPILDPESMAELLRQALERRGFTEAEDGRLSKTDTIDGNGEVILVDLELMEVVVRASEQKTLETEVVAEGLGESDHEARRDAHRELARRRQGARTDHDRAEEVLQEDLTDALAAGESRRKRDLNEAIQEAYAEALKRKARQLGDVIEVREGTNEAGEYELVIRVTQ